MNIYQQTIKEQFSISGVGLHTGQKSNITFKPAETNKGYRFKRMDLEGQPEFSASIEYVASTNRGTVLQYGDITISTIEHALAALVASGVDNVLMEIDADEVPILDGSSKIFTEHIEQVGVIEQDQPKKIYKVKEKIEFKDPATGSEYVLLPDDRYCLNVMIGFNSDVLYNQYAILNDLSEFKTEVAGCRTFVFVRELEQLLAHNLVKGGDLDNAIVIMDKVMSKEDGDRLCKLFDYDKLDYNKIGILNNIDLHFNNEPARHKLLDVIGDIALLGTRIEGRIIAVKPGHTSNARFTKVILEKINNELK